MGNKCTHVLANWWDREGEIQRESKRQKERQTDKDRGGHREMERDTCTSRIQRDKETENTCSLS